MQLPKDLLYAIYNSSGVLEGVGPGKPTGSPLPAQTRVLCHQRVPCHAMLVQLLLLLLLRALRTRGQCTSLLQTSKLHLTSIPCSIHQTGLTNDSEAKWVPRYDKIEEDSSSGYFKKNIVLKKDLIYRKLLQTFEEWPQIHLVDPLDHGLR